MNSTLMQAAALIVPLVVAIVFHEVAHGWAALALGDPTAREARRLSLNPLRHVDPVGTIILPGMLKLAGLPMFGWAKPVPVDFRRLRNPRIGMMLVASAGPASNFVLGAIGAVALGLLARGYGGQQPTGLAAFTVLSLLFFIQINVFLALFNLIPIPPFDGSHILEGLLPRGAAQFYSRLRGVGLLLVLGLLVVLPWLIPGFDPVRKYLMVPFEWVIGHYVQLANVVAGSPVVG